MAENRVSAEEIPEEETSSMLLDRFINVLDKTCESRFIYTTEDHCKELEKHNYILRRALVEIKQLIKEKATHNGSGFRCSWLCRLEMELEYAFIQLVPFLKRRMDVTHDDFVTAVHNAGRSMEDCSEQIHEICKEKFVVMDAKMLKSLDGMILNDIARLILREWACAGTDGVINGEVIVCPSSSALSVISATGAKEYGETGMGLKRWVDEKVFPLMSKKLVEYCGICIAESVVVYIETEQKTGELLFRLESACTSPTVAG